MDTETTQNPLSRKNGIQASLSDPLWGGRRVTLTFCFSIPKVEIISVHIPNTHWGYWANRPHTCRVLWKNANWISFGSSPPRNASQPLGGSWSQGLKGYSKANPSEWGQTDPELVALRVPLCRLPHLEEMQVRPWNRHKGFCFQHSVEEEDSVGTKMLKLYTLYSLFSFWEV